MDGRKRGSFTTGEPSVKRPRYEEAQQEPGDSEEEIAIHAIYEEDTLGLSSEGESQTRREREEEEEEEEEESFPLAKPSSRESSEHRRKVRRHYRASGEQGFDEPSPNVFLGGHSSSKREQLKRERHSHSPFSSGGSGRERLSKPDAVKRSSSERSSQLDRDQRGRERASERYSDVSAREWERSRQYKDQYSSSQKYRPDDRRDDPRGKYDRPPPPHRERESFEDAARSRSKEGLQREYSTSARSREREHSSRREHFSHSPRRIEKPIPRDLRDMEREGYHRSPQREEKLSRHHDKSRHKKHGRRHRSRRSSEEKERSTSTRRERRGEGGDRKALPLGAETIDALIKDLEESASSSSSEEYSGEGGEGVKGGEQSSENEYKSEKSDYSEAKNPPKIRVIRIKRRIRKPMTPQALEEGEQSSASDQSDQPKDQASLSPPPPPPPLPLPLPPGPRQLKTSYSSSSESSPEPTRVMRSKFDSDESDEEEEEEEETNIPTKLRKDYSGYHEVIHSEDDSDHSEKATQSDDKEASDGESQSAMVVEQPPMEGGPGEKKEEEEVVEEGGRSPSPGLPCYFPAMMGCRSVENYECLNRIEEGTYGIVYRGLDKKSNEVVALKRLKMEKEKEGFPITSLREINMLLKAEHQNIVHVREIVVGSNMDKIFIVMDYVEHDLKALMETMKAPFLPGEVKTLMIQLLRAVHHLHDNWILHRDLKTSNLLLSHKGILKVGDFGLAREYGSPLRNYTPVVVTLWYRAPELLLGAKSYSTAIDLWSVGCIFAEFILHKPLFCGKGEIDQLNQIFKELGTPTEKIWPGFSELPIAKKVTFAKQPFNNLRKQFIDLDNSGFDLLTKLLRYDPERRVSAKEALDHIHFKEPPMPVPPSMFPTWPAKSEMKRRKSHRGKSPTPPEGGAFQLKDGADDEEQAAAPRGFRLTQAQRGEASIGAGFRLKF